MNYPLFQIQDAIPIRSVGGEIWTAPCNGHHRRRGVDICAKSAATDEVKRAEMGLLKLNRLFTDVLRKTNPRAVCSESKLNIFIDCYLSVGHRTIRNN